MIYMTLSWVVSSVYQEPMLHSVGGKLQHTPQLVLISDGEVPEDGRKEVSRYLAERLQTRDDRTAVYTDSGSVAMRYTTGEKRGHVVRMYLVDQFLWDRVYVTEHWYDGEHSCLLQEVNSILSASKS